METKIYSGKAVAIMLCSDCNVKRCKHCYISYKGNFDPKVSLDMIHKLSKKYIVLLNGAEVLINEDYLKTYKENNQEWILTNGLRILNDKDIIIKLKENGIKMIEMSYHFGIQDELSIINEEKLRKIIKIVKDNDMKIKLLTTITSENYKDIDKICQKSIEYGVDVIKFINIIWQGKAIEMDNNLMLNDEQKKEFFKELNDIRKKIDINELKIERSGTFGDDKNNKTNFSCTAGKDLVVITPDNNVYPCVFLAKPGYEIGKFVDGNIYITKNTINHNKCIAEEICNHNIDKNNFFEDVGGSYESNIKQKK